MLYRFGRKCRSCCLRTPEPALAMEVVGTERSIPKLLLGTPHQVSPKAERTDPHGTQSQNVEGSAVRAGKIQALVAGYRDNCPIGLIESCKSDLGTEGLMPIQELGPETCR